ncbi:unnamed protein product [Parajaminaea phylloscopi]
MPTARASSSRTRSAKAAGSASSLSLTSSPQKRRKVQGALSFARAEAWQPTEAIQEANQDGSNHDTQLNRRRIDKGKAGELQPPSQPTQHKTELWSALFPPVNRAELAVHPRKVDDVERWLADAFHGHHSVRKLRRLLLLTGPVGSGKTQTLRQLSAPDQLDYEIIDFKAANPSSSQGWAAGDGYTGSIQKFQEFLSKAARFRTLAMRHDDADYAGANQSGSSLTKDGLRRLIVLEDLPTLSHAPTLAAFQDIIASFLAQPIDVHGPNIPVCIIISNSSSSHDASVDVSDIPDERVASDEGSWLRPSKLLGHDIISQSSWAEISFNEVATTFLKRALKTALEKAHRDGSPSQGRSRRLPEQYIEALAQDAPGDLRAAVDLLQQVHRLWQRDPSLFIASANPPKTKAAARESAAEVLLQLGLSQRRSALDIFHALGKMLYNKRATNTTTSAGSGDAALGSTASQTAQNRLPAHMQSLTRSASLVEVPMLPSSGVDAPTLQLFAHHNYPPFCDDVEQYEAIAEAHSFADSDMYPRNGDQFQTMQLSQQYSYLTTSYSTLLHLPSPAQRQHRLTKPAFFDVNARRREISKALESLQASQHKGSQLAAESWYTLQPHSELTQEWIPMLAKMAECSVGNSSFVNATLLGQIGKISPSPNANARDPSLLSMPRPRALSVQGGQAAADSDEDSALDTAVTDNVGQSRFLDRAAALEQSGSQAWLAHSMTPIKLNNSESDAGDDIEDVEDFSD